eukprot:15359935-Ditylum_brightwellii.AAC.1
MTLEWLLLTHPNSHPPTHPAAATPLTRSNCSATRSAFVSSHKGASLNVSAGSIQPISTCTTTAKTFASSPKRGVLPLSQLSQ